MGPKEIADETSLERRGPNESHQQVQEISGTRSGRGGRLERRTGLGGGIGSRNETEGKTLVSVEVD